MRSCGSARAKVCEERHELPEYEVLRGDGDARAEGADAGEEHREALKAARVAEYALEVRSADFSTGRFAGIGEWRSRGRRTQYAFHALVAEASSSEVVEVEEASRWTMASCFFSSLSGTPSPPSPPLLPMVKYRLHYRQVLKPKREREFKSRSHDLVRILSPPRLPICNSSFFIFFILFLNLFPKILAR